MYTIFQNEKNEMKKQSRFAYASSVKSCSSVYIPPLQALGINASIKNSE